MTAAFLTGAVPLVAEDAEPDAARPADEGLRGCMRAYQDGDTTAFERLWTELAPRLKRYFLARRVDPGLADDLVQETFLRLHQARQSYDPELPLEPWLFAIAHYVLLMQRRAHGRRARHEVRDETDAAQRAAPLAAAPPAEGRHLLGQLLSRLPAASRRPLVLHHLFGFDFQEIARRLGLSPGAARTRASRALAELREEAPREAGKPSSGDPP